MIWLTGGPRDFIQAFIDSGALSLRIDQTEGRTPYRDYRTIGSAIARDATLDAHVMLTDGKVLLLRGRREKKVYRPRSPKTLGK